MLTSCFYCLLVITQICCCGFRVREKLLWLNIEKVNSSVELQPPKTFTLLKKKKTFQNHLKNSNFYILLYLAVELLPPRVSSSIQHLWSRNQNKMENNDLMEKTKFQGCSVVLQTVPSMRMDHWFYILKKRAAARWWSLCIFDCIWVCADFCVCLCINWRLTGAFPGLAQLRWQEIRHR